MAKTDLRIVMPIGSPETTGKLSTAIIDRHTLLGAGSPLTGFVDMADFSAKTTNASNLQNTGNKSQAKAQSKYNVLQKHCGIAPGQNKKTEGTLYWYVLRVRDFLLLKYAGAEEQLSDWGFNVVLSSSGGHTYTRVEIPNDTPAALLGLASEINAQHILLGAGSPIPNTEIDMTVFNTLVTDGNTLLGEVTSANALAQSSHNQALQIWGYGQGQTSKTAGTLYNLLCITRERLKFKYTGAEEQLTEWGFNVIIGSHKPGKKKGNTIIAILEGDVSSPGINTPDLQGIEVQPTDTATFEVSAPLRIYASATPGEVPGPSTAFIDIQPGTNLVKTIEQLANALGLSELKPYLNIQNIGMATAHYKITFKMT